MQSSQLRFVVMLVVSVSAVALPIPFSFADEPAYFQKARDPCIDAKLRASVAEDLVIRKDSLLIACELSLNILAKENSRLMQVSTSAARSLAMEQKTSAALATKNEEQVTTIAAQDEVIVTTIRERDAALTTLAARDLSIKNANKTFMCEKLKIGCIDKR